MRNNRKTLVRSKWLCIAGIAALLLGLSAVPVYADDGNTGSSSFGSWLDNLFGGGHHGGDNGNNHNGGDGGNNHNGGDGGNNHNGGDGGNNHNGGDGGNNHNGGDDGGQHGGDHLHDDVPETPYAALMPVALLAAAAAILYRKRMKSS